MRPCAPLAGRPRSAHTHVDAHTPRGGREKRAEGVASGRVPARGRWAWEERQRRRTALFCAPRLRLAHRPCAASARRRRARRRCGRCHHRARALLRCRLWVSPLLFSPVFPPLFATSSFSNSVRVASLCAFSLHFCVVAVVADVPAWMGAGGGGGRWWVRAQVLVGSACVRCERVAWSPCAWWRRVGRRWWQE